eukprot:scaffold4740_cov165-Amphora_coffeaeformis.AAC.3
MYCSCSRLAMTGFIVVARLSSFVDAFVLPRDVMSSASSRRTFQTHCHHDRTNRVWERNSKPNFLVPLMMVPSKTATADNSTTTTTSSSSSPPDETLGHKLIVLEDVVERLQRQKSQVSADLKQSQSSLEEAKANLTAEIAKGREAVHEERRKHRVQVNELQDKLENIEQEMQVLREKNREKFERAKEKAMEEHGKLEAKAQKLADQLAAAQSKLDLYRKESYERETKIRQSLQDEQEARKEMEAIKEQAIEEAKKVKAAMAEQKETIEETLMISEAAVAAADRREATLKSALEASKAKIAELQSQLNATQTAAPKDTPPTKTNTSEVKELERKIFLMHQNFEAERQRERQKWGLEIEALQEALEIARNSNEEAPPTIPSQQQRSGKPGIIRRIQRKIRL